MNMQKLNLWDADRKLSVENIKSEVPMKKSGRMKKCVLEDMFLTSDVHQTPINLERIVTTIIFIIQKVILLHINNEIDFVDLITHATVATVSN